MGWCPQDVLTKVCNSYALQSLVFIHLRFRSKSSAVTSSPNPIPFIYPCLINFRDTYHDKILVSL